MKKIIRPSPEEDIEITKAALADSDNMPFRDEEWERVKPILARGRNRPLSSDAKEQVVLENQGHKI